MNTLLNIQELNYVHEHSSQEFFSFKVVGIRHDKIVFQTFTNWMCVVDECVHDTVHGIDDDTYDGMDIPVSPMVNIPTIDDVSNTQYNGEYQALVNEMLSKKLGDEFDFPLICEANEFDEIIRRKGLLGYKFVPEYEEFQRVEL